MGVQKVDGYYVGQRGWIDVLNDDGKRRWVEGEIVSLIPTPHNTVYAMIMTLRGRGVFRVW